VRPASTLDRQEAVRQRRLSRRALLLGGSQLAAFGLLAGRMYQLQVLESERYRVLADRNRISLRLEVASRGLILDRFGRPLAQSRSVYRIAVVPEEADDLRAVIDRLNELLPLAPGRREKVLELAAHQRSFIPIVTYENLSWPEIARVSVHAADLPGVDIAEVQQRAYPLGEVGAHIVGYVGAVSQAELTGDPVLSLPDFQIGKSGVEKVYDRQLRGVAGRRELEVNAVGRVVRELSRAPEQTGDTLHMALDSELQRTATALFGEETGAAVVMDAHNGEVITLASCPSFDPDLFAGGIAPKAWQALLSAPNSPLVNKAIAGQYAPGSTFKLVVALAALEAGVVNTGTTFHCSGALELGDGKFHCWRRGGHGRVNLHTGMVQSCDVYFYEVARQLGIDGIAAMARRLGMGETLGIDLPGERGGLIPDKDWKRRRLDQGWHIGETLIAGIGQGYVLATPLQLAVMTARLVNGGKAVVPRMMLSGNAGEPPGETASLGVSETSLSTVLRAMVGVTSDPRGTARGAQIRVPGLEMGGKTGTSQVRRISARERLSGVIANRDRLREHRDHALFVGFAPVSQPRLVTAVVVEHGGGGSAVAAPIARDLLRGAQLRLRREIL
jgi:penicillin-binding protein 2